MGAYKGGDARYNVISFRVSDEEHRLLTDLAGGKSVSDVIRQMFNDYVSRISEVRHDPA